MTMRPTDHVDVSRVEQSARAYVLQLFVEDYRPASTIADLTTLTVPEVETLLDLYGGRSHPDRLRISLEELRASSSRPAPVASTPDASPQEDAMPTPTPTPHRTPTTATTKWSRGASGMFECPSCDRKFSTPQGVGRHNASVHADDDSADEVDALHARLYGTTDDQDDDEDEDLNGSTLYVGERPEGCDCHRAPTPHTLAECEVDDLADEDDNGEVDDLADEDELATGVGADGTHLPGPARAELRYRGIDTDVLLTEPQTQRVLAMDEARRIHGDDADLRTLLTTAEFITTGALPLDEPAPRSSITTSNVQTLVQMQRDLMDIGYGQPAARAAVEQLVHRLANLDELRTA